MTTFGKTSIRGIRRSLSRFLAILSIVALGTGFLSGLLATTPDMKEASNAYFDDQKMYDFMIQCNLGVTEDDAKALEDMPEIEEAVSLYQQDVFMHDDEDEKYETRLTLFQPGEDIKINKPYIEDGRLPEKDDEIFACAPNEYTLKIKVGDVYKDGDGKEYKVVGRGDMPQFMSSHGENTSLGSGKVMMGFYGIDTKERDVDTVIYARGKGLPDDSFSNAYEKQTGKIEKKLKNLGKERSKIRRQDIVDEAQKKLDDKRKEYQDKKKEANDKLADAESKLEDGQRQIDDGWNRINSAIADLNANIDRVNAKQKQLDQLAPQIAQLEAAIKQGLPVPADKQAAVQQYYAGRQQLDQARAQIESARSQIRSQQTRLNKEQRKINRGWEDYSKEKKKADEKLAEAQSKIDDAQDEINRIKKAKWYIWNRNDNVGFNAYRDDVDKVQAVAKIFPVFFFLVAALVALTTMTRMIEEQRRDIGIFKALGYSNARIRNYYVTYGLVAAIIGAIVGQAIGFYLFPTVISNAYTMLYNLPPITPYIRPEFGIWVTLVTLLGILGTVLAATNSEVKEVPASLMLPKAPPPGKRILLEKIGFIWSRIKFSRKVTLRNLFRYKKRFLMTIIGVAGCYALLVAGFGIRDSIGNITNLQYNEINTYDILMRVKNTDWYDKIEGIDEFTKTSHDQGKANSPAVKQRKEISIIVPKDKEEIKKFIAIRDRSDGKLEELQDGRVVISEKLAEQLKAKVGSKITLHADGIEGKAKVGAICENYVGHIVYMTPKTYRDVFSKSPKFNYILAKEDLGDMTEKQLLRNIKEDENVEYILAISNVKKSFSDSVKSIDYIVLVLIIAAGALASIVLYNLTNVNICERKKELATIKVLGFFDKEVAGYIFREMHLLTLIGMVCGIPMGFALHKYIIKTVEVHEVMFGRVIAWQSFIYAAIITIVFAAIVNTIMKRVIKNIDMVESMKAND